MITIYVHQEPFYMHDSMMEWCEEHCKIDEFKLNTVYYQRLTTNGDCDGDECLDAIEFSIGEDATAFKLRFGL